MRRPSDGLSYTYAKYPQLDLQAGVLVAKALDLPGILDRVTETELAEGRFPALLVDSLTGLSQQLYVQVSQLGNYKDG